MKNVFYDKVQHRNQLADNDEVWQTSPIAEFHGRKFMLCVWWNHHVIIQFEFLNHNQTISTGLYSQ